MARSSKGRIFKRGKFWQIQFYIDGKEFKRALRDDAGNPITDKREAEKVRDKIMAPLAAQDEVIRRQQVQTALAAAQDIVKEADRIANRIAIIDAWALFKRSPNRPQCGPAMLTDYESRWKKFCDWQREQLPGLCWMNDITPQHTDEFAVWLTESGLSANRYNKIIQACRLLFSVLKIAGNPFQEIKSKALTTHGHRELSEGELRAICAAASGELRLMLAIGLYTALRLKDVALLRWESVDLQNKKIAVIPAKTVRRGKAIVIPLHPVLALMLEETPPENRRDYVLPDMARRYLNDNAKVTDLIQRHFRACGIETKEKHDNQLLATCRCGFHSLRHSFVSVCASKGVPLAFVQELCGHSNPAIQRHYLHLGATETAAAINALPDISTEVAAPAEPERERLAEFARIGDIAKIRKCLKIAGLTIL